MNYLCAAQTNIGIRKKTNQDSCCIKVAQTQRYGTVLFAAVCDGMGGLEKGELASTTVISTFMNWFSTSFAACIDNVTIDINYIRSEWDGMIKRLNAKIAEYGASQGFNLGTTIVAALCVNDKLFIANVGDSRLYKLTDKVYRLTTDHSLVAREIAAGNLRPEDEETDPRRNVLLQCVGASQSVAPEIKEYPLEKDALYLLCSDGFRHEISEEELYGLLSPNVILGEEALDTTLKDIIGLLMRRNESDNITAVAFKTV